MSPQSQQPHQRVGGSIAEGLDQRAREGRPVRVGLIGAGQMGTDIIVQTDLMKGIEVVAAADAIPENVFAARTLAGNGARVPEVVDDAAGAARSIARGRLAVSASYLDVCTADGVDVIIDATGNPNVGAQVALSAIAAGKHIVMMNVEADVTIGAYLSTKATEAGVVYTLGAGDEPSSTMELVNFLRGMGYPIVAAGKGKNNAFRTDATPDAYVDEAKRRNMNPRMLVEFVDGSKTMVEMVALANATGLVPDIPAVRPVGRARFPAQSLLPARGRRPVVAKRRGRLYRRQRCGAGRVRGSRDAPPAVARADERSAAWRRSVLHVLPALSPD